MLLEYLCPPALLYAAIMLIYLVLELSNEKYHQAFVKAIVGIIFTCILQAFCQMSLGVVSWLLVMIPIIFYTYITLLVFIVFGLNPKDKMKKFIVKQ
jgi:cellulose synthase/poly-beta-1,6-N-acetylglucosamine synthase-like glycosyltransferase